MNDEKVFTKMGCGRMPEKKRITFLFGAGAEGKGNYGLPKGAEYILDVFRLQEKLKENVLAQNFPNEYFKQCDMGKTYTYRRDTVDLAQIILKELVKKKASEKFDFYEKYQCEIEQLLNKDELKEVEEANENESKEAKLLSGENECEEKQEDNVEETEKEIQNYFKQILKVKSVKKVDITSPFCRDLLNVDNEGYVVIDYQKGLSGVLDSCFHTIINPNKYGVGKFTRIFNFYWSCYFAIIKPILSVLIDLGYVEFKQYFENDECKYEEIIGNIDTFTKLLYDVHYIKTEKKTYYDCIQEHLKKEQYECQGVLTTNYYNFCEQVPAKNYAYLNGQLKYFEYPENLEVADLSKEEKKEGKLFFPFIFGQSHVKPIVHSTQTEAFATMKKVLKKTEILIVLGYGISEDDNHINAFLHEFLNGENKKILCITEKDTEEKMAARLRMDGNIQGKIICNYENFDDAHNEQIIKNMFDRLGEI